jgi:polynucleotide 5'-kinase involved in rRNA processing
METKTLRTEPRFLLATRIKRPGPRVSQRADLGQDDSRAVSELGLEEIVEAVNGMNDRPSAEQSESASKRSVVLVTGMSGSGK